LATAGSLGDSTRLSSSNNRAGSIYGGSNEVQRNIMAKGVLGL
jgi:alkylation response protein AidB-like acyl-CoA dehydrogenase